MARISDEQIAAELAEKKFKPINLTNYKNMKSILTIECEYGHKLETDLFSFRKATFKCPICEGGEVTFKNEPPKKQGYRILALDNASQNMGVSLFDDGRLVYYSNLKFRDGLFDDRLVKIYSVLTEVLIKNWKPDYIVFEDVQYQNNFNTYKKLSMLLGTIVVAAKINNIPYEEIPPVRWRSHFQITGTRAVVKTKAVDLVKTMYNVNVIDDIAEAILIGKYASDNIVNKIKYEKGF